MKRSAIISAMVLILLFAVSWFAIPTAKRMIEDGTGENYTIPEPGETDSAAKVRVKIDDTVVEMTMDDYVQGVLRAEMPASFEPEALKAQAVAARTESYYKMANGPVANHPDADICNNINCCQAYISAEQANSNWGKDAEKYTAKIATAVRETDGMTILYNDVPIFAAFFSSAAGSTNDSGDVWLSSLPYLKSVDSPEGEEQVPNYYSVNTITQEDFKAKVMAEYPAADLSGASSKWIGKVDTDENGLVKTVDVGGVQIAGKKLRTMFGLRSASFTLEVKEESVIFRVTGYGHGVGMSQYGANVLAKEGKNYLEILKWYYTGVDIEKYTA